MAAFAATLALGDSLGLALEPAEAHDLAVALAKVEEYYPIPMPEEKHRALFSLALVAGRVYGKRAAPLFGFAPRPAAPVNPSPQTASAPAPAPTLNGARGGADAELDLSAAPASWFDAPRQ